jgi:hypothetical protein
MLPCTVNIVRGSVLSSSIFAAACVHYRKFHSEALKGKIIAEKLQEACQPDFFFRAAGSVPALAAETFGLAALLFTVSGSGTQV